MYRTLLLAIVLLTHLPESGAQNRIAFMHGNVSLGMPVYPQPGMDPDLTGPGRRQSPMSFSRAGKCYLFGGITRNGAQIQHANDMWEYDSSAARWSCLFRAPDRSGLGTYALPPLAPGVVPHPSARVNGMMWGDGARLFLYGGAGPGGGVMFDDIWEFDLATNSWKWLRGSTSANALQYGVKHIPASQNTPGHRTGHVFWSLNDTLYIHGGQPAAGNYHSDTWRYDATSNNWCWIAGPAGVPLYAYPPKGVADTGYYPRGRSGACSWKSGGKFYLYGGSLRADDMWEFDPAAGTWKWLSGPDHLNLPIFQRTRGIGIEDTFNTPAGRESAFCWSDSSRLYVFGGSQSNYFPLVPSWRSHISVWCYNLRTNAWSWVAGDTSQNTMSIYGTKGYKVPGSAPGTRHGSAVFETPPTFHIYGGYGPDIDTTTSILGDHWIFDTRDNSWTWAGGIHNAASQAVPGSFRNPDNLTFPNIDPGSCVWNLGDTIYVLSAQSSRMWRYSPATNLWTTLRNDPGGVHPVYGQKGIPAITNLPGARVESATWVHNGKLYLYGGKITPPFSWAMYYGDLWEFNPATNLWRWVSGTSSGALPPVHSGQNNFSINNFPGGRGLAATALIGDKLWLYGGYGVDSSMMAPSLSDLWCLNMKSFEWALIDGPVSGFRVPVFDSLGVASAKNRPGSKYDAQCWSLGGSMYIRSGISYVSPSKGYGTSSDDMWRYDTTSGQWTWISGTLNAAGSWLLAKHGLQNVPDTANYPGHRTGAATWVSAGKLCMFGGDNATQRHNDIWEFDTGSRIWTWVFGKKHDTSGYCSSLLIADPGNFPGSRAGAKAAVSANHVYLVGGLGNPAFSETIRSNMVLPEIWRYESCPLSVPCPIPAPVAQITSQFGADSLLAVCDGRPVYLNAGNPGASYLWNTGETTQAILVSTAGKYWVRITNAASVSVTDTVSVNIGSTPAVSLGADTAICSNVRYTLRPTVAGGSFLWQDGSTNTSYTYSNDSSKIVWVEARINNCYNADTVSLKSLPLPAADSISVSGIAAGSYTFTLHNPRDYKTLQWDLGDGTISTAASPTHTYLSDGVYNVRVILSNDCGDDTLRLTIRIDDLKAGTAGTSIRLQVSPNPARESVTIRSSEQRGTLLLRSLSGQVLLSATLENGQTRLGTSQLAPAVYIIELTYPGGTLRDLITIIK